MFSMLLLSIIYIAFISLGLPDSLLGVSWPVMRHDFGAGIGTAGWVFMTIAGGTIVSSLLSGRVLSRFETGRVTFFCSLLTAGALLGYYFAPSLTWLFLLAIPLGLGGGAVDAALNHYVSTHFKAHHMNWLHCFWGIGATLGPLVMAAVLSATNDWRNGYLAVAIIQLALALLLFATLPLWKKQDVASASEAQVAQPDSQVNGHKPKGLSFALSAFFLYCGAEALIGLWGSSYLVQTKQFSVETAATWVSVYYASITVGRFVSGFISFKVSNRLMIRYGQLTALLGSVLLFLPSSPAALIGFILIGLGLAPIYPSMLHETPARFGHGYAKHIMGYQMAFAYTGSTFLPPLFGWAASASTLALLPYATFLILAVLLLSSERLNHLLKNIRVY
ncbi:MFS transporter [Exiguobacterium flavidum]|uniref:MFS transporter n=1 Tax=Exiguobacterium flavidum TaxID=2184695 RepID=UPI000DF7DC1E|nr:MFS transporter [Exiguobacterium flavidum]